jgi:hypothetical protein
MASNSQINAMNNNPNAKSRMIPIKLREWILFAVVSFAITVHGEIVIGCFDTNRAGVFSPSAGSSMTSFRANIAANFPGATFQSTNLLTSSFLSSINLLVITAVGGNTSGITPLNAAEQGALTNFVLAGGAALLCADNDIQFQPASQSMVQPFGLDCTGNLPNSVVATITNLTHPVTDGPFGAVTSYTVASYPGWFDILGPYAVGIATLNPNGEVSLAAIAPGVLSGTSGGVVFFSDSTINDGSFTNTLPTLVDNAVDFVLAPSARPTLFITNNYNATVTVFWETRFTGFRLEQTTNLLSNTWTDQSLTGANIAVVAVSNSATFFRLINP